jgi:hypothetical protein
MAAKKATKKGPGKPGLIDEEAIRDLMDKVTIPRPPFLKSWVEPNADRVAWWVRFERRVMAWAKNKPPEVVAKRLAEVLIWKQFWERSAEFDSESHFRTKAIAKVTRQKAGRAGVGRHKAAIEEEWNGWQQHPERFADPGAFKAAMEVKYPGANSGTISNWITVWKRSSRR